MQQQEWKGSRSQRFSGGRIHLKPQDEFASTLKLRQANQSLTGIRTYSPNPTPQAIFKPHLRVYDDKYNSVTKQIDLRGKKPVRLPSQNQRIRPQKLHLPGGQKTQQQINLRGIRAFDESNKSRDNHYYVQNQMQRKVKLYGLQSLRNDLTVASMGDKAYKYPQYAPDFYKDGGLIAGSTQKPRQRQVAVQIKQGSIFTKPNWDVRVKMQEKLEERKVVDSIDQWEKTTLKENNPNWNDPQTFFQRMEANQAAKDPKKVGKK